MSFLAPLFLVGALAIAAPILFHLIRRTVKERVRFSTLMFLKESPPRLTRRSHLENWLLLLLRCAIICLLAASFARPYFRRASTEPPIAPSGRRVVVLVDTSASMRRTGLWDAAKRAAAAAIQRAEPNDSLALLAFDSAPRTLFSFEDWKTAGPSQRAATAASRLDAAAPTWAATHLGKALTAAGEMILDASRADSEGEKRSRVILISDLQQGARLDGLQGFEWPKGCEVILEPVLAKTGNAGLQVLNAAPGESLSVTNTRLRARVFNSAAATVEQFKVGWAPASGLAFDSPPLELHVPGGQNRSISLPAAATNASRAALLLTGDTEPFDNHAYHAAPPRQTLRVAYIGRDKEDDPNGQLFYLRRAFPETASFAVRVDSREPGSGAPIDASLAILSALSPADVPALKTLLASGRGVLFVVGEGADLSPVATLTGAAAPAATEATGPYVMLAQIDFADPLFAQFRDARFNDFTKIHFWKHRRLDLAALPAARVIAAFDDTTPALVQIPLPAGALHLLASGWNPTDSQLALSTKFVPLLYSLLEQSAPLSLQTRQLLIGDAIPYPADFSGESIAIQKPDGASAVWKKGEALLPDQPGFYTAANPNLLFAANLDPSESRTAPVPEEQLASMGLPLKRDESPISLTEQKQREQLLLATEQESRQKLWRRLLVVALALLLLESIIAKLSVARPVPA